MNEVLIQYRKQFMIHVLRRVSRTGFENIVDFGCGDGSILRQMAREMGAKRAKGIDLRVSEVPYGPIVLHRGNLLEYVPDEQYQLVISNQVFEHIWEPWLPKYFQVLKASCAPDGVVLMSTPNRWRPKNIVRGLMFLPPENMNPNKGVPPEQHRGHHRECSYHELRAILKQYFQEPEWSVRIIRTVPRILDSRFRWITNVLVYFLLWIFWRPLFVSASQDHYVLIQHNGQQRSP